MIDRERWLEAMRERLGEDAGGQAEVAGFHIAERGSLVLHDEETAGLTARGAAGVAAGAAGETASLMRFVCEEAARDTEELLEQAQRLDAYAHTLALKGEGEGLPLPIYASATPNGRVVANFCACSPFDETDEAVAMLDRFLQDNPLNSPLNSRRALPLGGGVAL